VRAHFWLCPASRPACRCIIHTACRASAVQRGPERPCDVRASEGIAPQLQRGRSATPSIAAASPWLTSCTTLLYVVATTITHLEPLNYRAARTLHHPPGRSSTPFGFLSAAQHPYAPATSPPRDHLEPPHPPRQPTTLADDVSAEAPTPSSWRLVASDTR
jgi:hypothetical protein